MNYDTLTDDELRTELQRLLGEDSAIGGLELHCCYLVRVKYSLPVLVGATEPWQEQARHILRHMAAHDALMETKA